MTEQQRTEPEKSTERRKAYPAEKARQGEIILRTPLRKAIFFGGLVALVLLAVILSMLGLR